MTVARSPEEVPPEPSTVTVGFFDGVHRGHQALLRRGAGKARAQGTRLAVVTFDRHPAEVIRPGSEPALLMSPDRRVATLRQLGADLVLVLPFTPELSRLTPEEFVEGVLVAALGARRVVVGENFRFGHQAAGDVATLTKLGDEHGFTVDAVGILRDGEVAISASEIRRRLAEGDVEWAAGALGRPHVLEGPVVRGEGRGRSLGIPTANVEVPARMQLPANGVYAGYVEVAGRRSPAATNVGVRPTFGGEHVTIEAHLLDVDEDLYGRHAVVEFHHRLRGERRFSGPDELIGQIRADISQVRTLLGLG